MYQCTLIHIDIRKYIYLYVYTHMHIYALMHACYKYRLSNDLCQKVTSTVIANQF